MDELVHHWPRLPFLSYLRPVDENHFKKLIKKEKEKSSQLCRKSLSSCFGLFPSAFRIFTVIVKAVRELVSYYHPDGAVA